MVVIIIIIIDRYHGVGTDTDTTDTDANSLINYYGFNLFASIIFCIFFLLSVTNTESIAYIIGYILTRARFVKKKLGDQIREFDDLFCPNSLFEEYIFVRHQRLLWTFLTQTQFLKENIMDFFVFLAQAQLLKENLLIY